MTKVYFPNINSLRFFAATSVIIQHITHKKLWYEQQETWYKYLVTRIAHVGIITFFELSSFLITYLLLMEKAKTNDINIKKFYARRILRIWPLYYFIIFVSFFIMPHFNLIPLHGYPQKMYENFYLSLFFCIILLPNIAFSFCRNIYIQPAWTLGIEEPFYLIWPWLVKRSGNLFRMMTIVSILCVLLKILVAIIEPIYVNGPLISEIYHKYSLHMLIAFPIGGIIALIHFHKKQAILKVFYNIYIRVIVYIVTLFVLLSGVVFPLYYDFYSISIAILILNMATNKRNMVNLDNKVLNYLGTITYGYYMYHVLVMMLIYRFIRSEADVMFGILVFVLTTIIAIISYELVERKILMIKKRYAVIQST
jgi:peptidoglycan/LPS O-acetylase OafA/YrhL